MLGLSLSLCYLDIHFNLNSFSNIIITYSSSIGLTKEIVPPCRATTKDPDLCLDI